MSRVLIIACTCAALATTGAQARTTEQIVNDIAVGALGWERCAQLLLARRTDAQAQYWGARCAAGAGRAYAAQAAITRVRTTHARSFWGQVSLAESGRGRWGRTAGHRRPALDPALIEAIIHVESAGNPNARSSAGAIGLMQVMPATAMEVLDTASRAHAGACLWNGRCNRWVGTRYLARQLARFGGDWLRALSAYHAGPNRTQRLERRLHTDPMLAIDTWPVRATRSYLRNVLLELWRRTSTATQVHWTQRRIGRGQWPIARAPRHR